MAWRDGTMWGSRFGLLGYVWNMEESEHPWLILFIFNCCTWGLLMGLWFYLTSGPVGPELILGTLFYGTTVTFWQYWSDADAEE